MSLSNQVDKLISTVGNSQSKLDYFFSKLSSPKWITPLKEKGFFSNPKQTIKFENGISFPVWAESQYLARIAEQDPGLVLETILNIPETDNHRIHADYVDGVLKMSPELASKWVMMKEEKWLRRQTGTFDLLPMKYGPLISHLAKGGENKSVVSLCSALLRFTPNPEVSREFEFQGEKMTFPKEPIPLVKDYYFNKILTDNIPDVIELVGTQAITMLMYILAESLSIDLNNPSENDQEHSYWRSAIEDHEQNSGRKIKGEIVAAIRNGCEQLIQSGKNNLLEIVSLLEEHNLSILRRISLHLLRTCSTEADIEIIKAHILNKNSFSNIDERHEYSLLIQKYFNRLENLEQSAILGWIDEGPDYLRDPNANADLTDEQKFNQFGAWQRDRLTMIRDDLPKEWQNNFEKLLNKYGENDHPEFDMYSYGGFTGPNSPLSIDELSSKNVDELIEYIKTWVPPKGFMEASPEGLSRAISGMVEQNPVKYAVEANKFKLSAPTYVNGIISGFEQALRKNNLFDWQNVYDLCRWVVGQSDEIDERYDISIDDEADPDWGWTRKSVASVLDIGLSNDEYGMSIDDKETIWNILIKVTRDPDPADTAESYEDSAFMDPATKAINTVRGEAIHAVKRYALWNYRIKTKEANGEKVKFSFSVDIPEVKEVFDHHLNKENDPSLTIHSIFGQWIPHLLLMDEEWTKENISRILPDEMEMEDYYTVAWDTYLNFCQPYDTVFIHIRDQYERAINRLENYSKKESRRDPYERLCIHLMSFYFRDDSNEHRTEELIDLFFSKAPDESRGYSLDYIGRILLKRKSIVDTKEFNIRMRKLWQRRFRFIRKQQNLHEYEGELTAFAYWFASGKFNVRWSLKIVREVLNMLISFGTGYGDADIIVKRLAELSDNPEINNIVLDCLERVSKLNNDAWEIYNWEGDAKVILGNAISSDDIHIQRRAKDIINYFGTIGIWSFRELLPKKL